MAHRVPTELQSLPNLRNQQQVALAREQREETSRARQVDAQRALQKEMIKLQKEPLEGFRINLDDENILKWTAVIFGPPDTPYQGGYFKASLDFSCHPFWPPVIRFTPPIHHPNIYESGMLCYQLVRPPVQGSSGSTWNVRNLLLSFLALLVEPNPDSPANEKAAIQYRQYKEEGDPTYLNAIKANVAESRELAKRDNVIVPETNEDYTRSGIPTEQQQQSNQTEANVQEEEAQEDDIAYPEDEWTNSDDDNEGIFENLDDIRIRIGILANDHPQHQHDDEEEDREPMTPVEDDSDAETANSNTEDALYEETSSSDEEEETNANRHVLRGARTVYQVRRNAREINSEDTLYEIIHLRNQHQHQHDDGEEDGGLRTAVEVGAEQVNSENTFYNWSYAEENGDTEDEQQQPEEGGPTIATEASASISSVYRLIMRRPEPTIATQASASISSVYLHDMPRPEPAIATQASASISSVYLHDMPRPEPAIATQASASISSVYLHDVPRPEPTIANRQLSNDSVYL